ncbi:MAG: malto-oligosyltrehalose trehalohydrolase [Candidatus Levyibacteriota bacterium]
MKFRHDMPFGAARGDDGTTRFRLWAPAATQVDLVLGHDGMTSDRAMRACDGGWYEALVTGAGAGSRYAFRIDGTTVVPDPASRFNPDDVHAPSAVVDPHAFDWREDGWRGRPWEEAVIYELHVGSFTPAGTFDGVVDRLDYLAALGVTAIEMMPIADFPGTRNWGYDGVLPFAPDASYGPPQALKRLVQAAHARDLMVLLDVVYNHFGPEGNYLCAYAPQFFNPRHQTPWGAAINFDGEQSRTVRDFFVHNARYWLEEYRFDGLRIDAVHAIADDSRPDIVSEIAAAVRADAGRLRHVHVVLENDRNEARYLERDRHRRPRFATAQWNDDVHHAAHVLATGERDGYYGDYAATPLQQLARGLAEGFVYQGEPSPYRNQAVRGEPSCGLPATAFVNFLQTHDQVGNRAFGERIGTIAAPQTLAALAACLLLAPSPPLIFMGEEFGASTPFLYFCDFGPELAEAVTRGRQKEFARFERFRAPGAAEAIPDPCAASSFTRSRLDWRESDLDGNRVRLAGYRELLALRREHVVPRLARLAAGGRHSVQPPRLMRIAWAFDGGEAMHLLANLGDEAASDVLPAPGRAFHVHGTTPALLRASGRLEAWSVVWTIAP